MECVYDTADRVIAVQGSLNEAVCMIWRAINQNKQDLHPRAIFLLVKAADNLSRLSEKVEALHGIND